MAITPLPTAPSRDRPGTFVSEANAFLGALPILGTEINVVSAHMMTLEGSTYSAMTQAQQAAANAAASVNSPSYTGSSITSLDLSFGVKSLSVPTGKNWNGGMQLQLWSDATHFMSGTVVAYVGDTLTISITNVTGAGTFGSWQISVLPSITGLSASHVINALGYEPVRPNGTGAFGVWPIHITGTAGTVVTLNRGQVISALGYEPPGVNGHLAHGNWNINVTGWAGAVDWPNVTNRPSLLSQFGNDVGYINGNMRAYPKKAGGGDINFIWEGQPGQPPWLLGGHDGTNFHVYNPSNFNVNYANSAGVAGSANAVHWNGVVARPTQLSQFVNDQAFAQQSWVSDNFFNFVTHVNHYLEPPIFGPEIMYCQEVSLEDAGGNLIIHRWYRNEPDRYAAQLGGNGGS